MATAEQLNQAIALIQGNQYADAEALLTPLLNPVSYTHLTLPTNREV